MSGRELKSSQSTENSPTNQKCNCPNCKRDFNPENAYQIVIRSPSEADFMCPWCKQTFTGSSPDKTIDRPPAIVGKSCRTDGDGLTTAKMIFEGGAWLQYRETPDGLVREEMYNADEIEVESFKAEYTREDCDPATEYLDRAVKRYKKYTKTGLRIQRPHIAAVLLHGH